MHTQSSLPTFDYYGPPLLLALSWRVVGANFVGIGRQEIREGKKVSNIELIYQRWPQLPGVLRQFGVLKGWVQIDGTSVRFIYRD